MYFGGVIVCAKQSGTIFNSATWGAGALSGEVAVVCPASYFQETLFELLAKDVSV